MRSIPVAMAWELYRRSWWEYLLVLATVVTLPVLIMGALVLERAFDPQDASMRSLNLVLLVVQALGCIAISAQPKGHPSRLYPWPVSTRELVLWTLAPAMLAGALMSVLSAGILDLLFACGWPMLGPALFVATAVALAHAVLWLAERALALQVLGLTGSGAGLFFWLSLRYPQGPAAQGGRLWMEVTAAEWLTLALAVVVSYTLAVVAIGRDRCGETLGWERFREWWERRTTRAAGAAAHPFRSPALAHLWFEWRMKGHVLPLISLIWCGMVFCLSRFQRFQHEPDLLGSMSLLPGIGFLIGMYMGNCSMQPKQAEMSSFLATRPLGERALADGILRTAALSTVLATFIWLLFYGWLKSTLPVSPNLARDVAVGVALVVATWVAVSSTACLTMTGRPQLVMALILGSCGLGIGTGLLTKYVIPAAYTSLFGETIVSGIGLALCVGTAVLYLLAWRQGLIGVRTVIAGGILWIALGCLAIGLWNWQTRAVTSARPQPLDSWPLRILLEGGLALCVAPLAAGPLAIYWNRHR